jgi:hypothetical protein
MGAVGQGSLEAAPGLTIGSPHHSEPIARFSGYLMNAEANADRAIACVNALAGVPNPEHIPALLDALAGVVHTIEINYPEDRRNNLDTLLVTAYRRFMGESE